MNQSQTLPDESNFEGEYIPKDESNWYSLYVDAYIEIMRIEANDN
jgi:hypothetical protein